jgi:hypothetical protein
MSYWQILKPQAGQNLIVDPSFEDINGPTGWGAVDVSGLLLTTDWQYRKVLSWEVQPTSGTTGGVWYITNTLTAAAYTFSIYGKFVAGVPYRIRFANTGGTTVGSAVNFTGTGTTQRVSVTATLTAAVHHLYVQKNGSASTASFYLDAAQLELGSVATTYIDGDEPGCTWDGGRFNSSSTRSANTTAGGVWLDFEDDLGIIPMEMQGVGMPPIDNVATPYALLPGSLFERSLARSRVFTIICLIPGSTWQNMHALREALIARVQPNQTTQQAPVYLRYSGASENQIIAAHYDSGLDFNQPSGFAETVALRFVAHDPFWYSDRDYGILASSNAPGGSPYVSLLTPDGYWNDWLDIVGAIYVVYEDFDNTLLIGGDFTDAGGNVGWDYLVRWSPHTNTFSNMGQFNNIVRGIAPEILGAAGAYVVVGDFTTVDGNTVRRIALGDNTGWSEFANANASVTSVITTRNYTVVAGNFTTIDGVSRARIARYDINAGTWSSIGAGLNAQANALMINLAVTDAFYVGGAFTTAAGTTVNRIAYYGGTGSAFTAMGTTGVNGTVNALTLASDGLLYVGGAFTTAGGIAAPYIAQWTGTGWQALPSGPLSAVTALTIDVNNNVYAAAASGFTRMSTAVAVYGSGTWLPFRNLAISSDGINYLYLSRSRNYAIISNNGTGIYFDFLIAETVINTGTAPTGVIVVTVNGFPNVTTDQTVYLFNPFGDLILVDTRDGQQSIVDYVTSRSRADALRSGSDLGGFVLQPGENQVTSEVSWVWRPRNWSLDV